MNKTLEIDPDYFYAWYGKGLALHSLNNYQEAIKCYEKVLENDPVHIDAWFNKKACDSLFQDFLKSNLIMKNIMQRITEQLIEEIKDRIVSAVQPEKIILFGSYAYGTPTKDSDLDLLVIMPSIRTDA